MKTINELQDILSNAKIKYIQIVKSELDDIKNWKYNKETSSIYNEEMSMHFRIDYVKSNDFYHEGYSELSTKGYTMKGILHDKLEVFSISNSDFGQSEFYNKIKNIFDHFENQNKIFELAANIRTIELELLKI